MGIRLTGLLLFILSCLLHTSESVSPSQTDWVSGRVRENSMGSKTSYQQATTREETNKVVEVDKRGGSSGSGRGLGLSAGHASGVGGRGGSTGGRTYGGGNSGSSTSPYVPATTTTIPLYGARGAGHHRSSGNRRHVRVDLAAVKVLALVFLGALF